MYVLCLQLDYNCFESRDHTLSNSASSPTSTLHMALYLRNSRYFHWLGPQERIALLVSSRVTSIFFFTHPKIKLFLFQERTTLHWRHKKLLSTGLVSRKKEQRKGLAKVYSAYHRYQTPEHFSPLKRTSVWMPRSLTSTSHGVVPSLKYSCEVRVLPRPPGVQQSAGRANGVSNKIRLKIFWIGFRTLPDTPGSGWQG